MNKYIFLIGVFSITLLYSCGGKNVEKEQNEEKTILVTTELVTKGIVKNEDIFTALLEAETTNNITSQTGGRLQSLLVSIGDKVRKGQVLAILDKSQLNQAQIKLDNAKLDYTRANELYKVGGISKSQWEQIKSQLEIIQQQYNNINDNTVLKSPINGIITKKNYDEGDMTSVQLPIFVVENIKTIKLKIKLSEKYYPLLKLKMPVTIYVETLPNKYFSGYIYKIYPTVDFETHSLTVEVYIDNKNEELRPGMYAKASINWGDIESILVPDMSVITQIGSGQKIVYVIENGKAEAKEVQLGRLDGNKYQVLSGVKEGDKIINSNLNILYSGMPVSESSSTVK